MSKEREGSLSGSADTALVMIVLHKKCGVLVDLTMNNVYFVCLILLVSIGLNYKKLTDENENPLETLEPILTSQNILSISKLAHKIPKNDGSMLSPSSVYTVWLQKLFWNGDQHLIKKIPETMEEWLHAYDMCSKYFDRLDPADIVTFIDEITFSSRAVTKVSRYI